MLILKFSCQIISKSVAKYEVLIESREYNGSYLRFTGQYSSRLGVKASDRAPHAKYWWLNYITDPGGTAETMQLAVKH